MAIITNRVYRDEIQAIAEAAVEESQRDDRPLGVVVDEMLSSHPWVTDTFKAAQAGLWTSDRDAWREISEDPDKLRAYAGMLADVWDRIDYERLD